MEQWRKKKVHGDNGTRNDTKSQDVSERGKDGNIRDRPREVCIRDKATPGGMDKGEGI